MGRRQGFRYLQHPPYSPDLNPIKNCWAILKRQLAQTMPRPTTINDMFALAQRIWMNIPQSTIDATVDSMIWRVKELCRNRGRSLPY